MVHEVLCRTIPTENNQNETKTRIFVRIHFEKKNKKLERNVFVTGCTDEIRIVKLNDMHFKTQLPINKRWKTDRKKYCDYGRLVKLNTVFVSVDQARI